MGVAPGEFLAVVPGFSSDAVLDGPIGPVGCQQRVLKQVELGDGPQAGVIEALNRGAELFVALRGFDFAGNGVLGLPIEVSVGVFDMHHDRIETGLLGVVKGLGDLAFIETGGIQVDAAQAFRGPGFRPGGRVGGGTGVRGRRRFGGCPQRQARQHGEQQPSHNTPA